MLADSLLPDIQDTLDAFRDEVRTVLGGNLVAIYVDGSLTVGDFEAASSDLDFLVVVERPLSAGDVDRIAAMHERLKQRNSWGARLEGEYAVRELLRPWGVEGATTTVSPNRGLWLQDPSWLTAENVLALREHGRALYGLPSTSVLPVVDRATLDRALRDYLAEIVAETPSDEASLDDLASDVLNAARCLFGLRAGRACTKAEAASWLASRVPGISPALLAALDVRRGLHPTGARELFKTALLFLRNQQLDGDCH